MQGKMSAISKDVNEYNFPRRPFGNIYQKSLKYMLCLYLNYISVKLGKYAMFKSLSYENKSEKICKTIHVCISKRIYIQGYSSYNCL